MNQTQAFDVPGAPDHELRRSSAAALTGRLASASGLLMAHFEYRVPLEPPAQWLPLHRPDLGAPAEWQAGVLPESKYQSFRNDLMIGSFHPGHRAKWTAHELCHGLVGFAWRPDATPFFHAQAARLTELLPVALFYFFDEADLNRCPEHQDAGPLFRLYCPDCETAAAQGPRADAPMREARLREGRAFVSRELRAVERSVREGRPIASPWGGLDLSSDGLAYAAAQSRRLQSPEFARFVALFHRPGTGFHDSLESLAARVIELADGFVGSGEPKPWPVDRWTWIRRDLAWRFLEIRAQTEAEPARELDRLVDALAENAGAVAVETAIAGYEALCEEWTLPEPQDVFAVGYALPRGFGRSIRQIGEGVASACPLTWSSLGDEAARRSAAAGFAAVDRFERKPLGARFADWLLETYSGDIGDLAAFEAAVAHAPPRDLAAETLGAAGAVGGWRVHPGVRLVETTWSTLDAVGIDAPAEERLHPPLLAVRRGGEGEPEIVHPEPRIAEALRLLNRGEQPSLSAADAEGLAAQGLIAPNGWRLGAPVAGGEDQSAG